jgi:hypothetical protein
MSWRHDWTRHSAPDRGEPLRGDRFRPSRRRQRRSPTGNVASLIISAEGTGSRLLRGY